jgi:hypothetical protein
MSEEADGLLETASADRDAVKAALMAFGRRYLHALEWEDGSPTPFQPGGWRSHPQAPEMFVPLEARLPTFNFQEWDEYRAIEELVTSRPRLHRLITKPMYAPTDQVPEFLGLLSGVVAIPIERYQAILFRTTKAVNVISQGSACSAGYVPTLVYPFR